MTARKASPLDHSGWDSVRLEMPAQSLVPIIPGEDGAFLTQLYGRLSERSDAASILSAMRARWPHPGAAPEPLRIPILLLEGTSRRRLRDHARAVHCQAEALAYARSEELTALESDCHRALAITLRWANHWPAARHHIALALSLSAAAKDAVASALNIAEHARLLAEASDVRPAARLLAQSEALLKEYPSGRCHSQVLLDQFRAAILARQWADAREAHATLEPLLAKTDEAYMALVFQVNAVDLLVHDRALDQAQLALTKAQELGGDGDDWNGRLVQSARASAQRLSDPQAAAEALKALAEFHETDGQVDSQLDCGDKLLECLASQDRPADLQDAYQWLRSAAARQGAPFYTDRFDLIAAAHDIPLSGDTDKTENTPTPNRFLRLKQLGSGGHGAVSLAYDTARCHLVAYKTFHAAPQPAISSELGATRTLAVPGIARIIASGTQADGQMFVASTYVEGAPLRSVMAANAAEEAIRSTVTAAAQTLSRCHEAGVLHLDIKPENIVIDPTGAPVLIDFGTAQLAEDAGEAKGATPAYAAPEQRSGGKIGPQTDFYALGIIAYEWACGQRPDMPEPGLFSLIARKKARAVQTELKAKVPDEAFRQMILEWLRLD